MALTRWRTQTLLGTNTANWNFTYLDNGNVNFPDNKKYSRSKPTIIRIPPTTLMPIRLTLLFFIILFAKTNSSAPTTIIKTDINGYMSFLLSNSDLLSRVYHTASRKTIPDAKKAGYRRYGDTLPLFFTNGSDVHCSCPVLHEPRFCKRCSGRRSFLGRHSYRSCS